MTKEDFMKLVHVAWDDLSAADPACIGLIQVALYQTEDDSLRMELGATVPGALVRYALGNLAAGWISGTGPAVQTLRSAKLRKVRDG